MGERAEMDTVVRSMKKYVEECIPEKVSPEDLISFAKNVDDTVARLTSGKAKTCLQLKDCDAMNTAEFKKAVFEENRAFGIMYPKTLCCMLAGEIDADGVARMICQIPSSTNDKKKI